MVQITKCKPQRIPLKSNVIRKADRKPLNHAKNSKIMRCGHEKRYFVLEVCAICQWNEKENAQ